MTNPESKPVSLGPAASCHLCGAAGLAEFTRFRSFRRVTSDCRFWPAGGRLCICPACGGVQKLIDDDWQREVDELYAGYAIYEQAEGAEQAVFDSASGAAASRSQRLLAALGQAMELPATGRLLDVGCGNGAMLRAFSRAAPRWSLAGTELSDKYRRTVEAIPGVESLHTCPPGEVPGQFDVVSMIHVLEHIPKPEAFVRGLLPKLAPGGLLLVELPHHVANPFELLIADHCTHFAAATAATLLERCGLEVLAMAEDWVPKELTLVARRPLSPSGGAAPPVRVALRGVPTAQHDRRQSQSPPVGNALRGVPAAQHDRRQSQSPPVGNALRGVPRESDAREGAAPDYAHCVAQRLDWLGQVAGTARQLAARREIGLFGTSVAATWLFAEVEGAAAFFVDEDPHRIGKQWQGRPVHHPRQVPDGSCLMIPLPQALAEGISRRIARPGLEIVLPPAMPEPAAGSPP